MDEAQRRAGALRGLVWAWELANATYLKGALRPPVFALIDRRDRLGAWIAATRTIHIDAALAIEGPWHRTAEVLRHEMAHQYVDEVLGVHDERPHGPAFVKACEALGIDPVVAGFAPSAPSAMPKRLATIRKLFALADSPSRHEAEAAARAAHRMLTRYNLDLSDLETGSEAWTARIIGPHRVRFARWERMLVGLLGRYFYVRVVWIPVWLVERGCEGRAAEAHGRPDNLDMAAYVYGFVRRTALGLWRAEGGSRRDRGSFLCGVIAGLERTLRQQREEDAERGLVWVGEAGLDAYTGRRYPVLRTRRGRRGRVTAAYGRGVAAGEGIVLRRPIAEDPSGARPRIGTG